MASVFRMLVRNWLPMPSPLLAPFTRPAMSTNSTVAGTCGGKVWTEGVKGRGQGTQLMTALLPTSSVTQCCPHTTMPTFTGRKKGRNRERREERKKERNKGRKYAEKLDKASLSTVCSHRQMVTDSQKAACALTTSRRSKNRSVLANNCLASLRLPPSYPPAPWTWRCWTALAGEGRGRSPCRCWARSCRRGSWQPGRERGDRAGVSWQPEGRRKSLRLRPLVR